MIITVTNRKGGVGKSTISAHLASGLAIKGYNVALVDTDSQGHASDMLGMQPADSLFELLINKAPLEQVVKLVPKENYGTHETPGNLVLIPSHHMTHKIPYQLEAHESFLFLERLNELKEKGSIDFIIIDTPPTMSLFDGSIYLAADAFLYITEVEKLALRGLQEAVQQLQNFSRVRQQHLNKTSRIMGIIPNKYRSRTILHQHNLKQLLDAFGELVWNPVTLRTAWADASNFSCPVFISEPKSRASRDAWDIINRVEQQVIQWQNVSE